MSDSDIDFQEIAKLKWAVVPHAMNNAFVYRKTALARKASIVKKGAYCTFRTNQFTHPLIQLVCRHSRGYQGGRSAQDTGSDLTSRSDKAYLRMRFVALICQCFLQRGRSMLT
jgi:hypothetical protein